MTPAPSEAARLPNVGGDTHARTAFKTALNALTGPTGGSSACGDQLLPW
jgi:hypothetical protein